METFVPQMTLTGSDGSAISESMADEDEENATGVLWDGLDSVNTRLRMGDDPVSCKSLRACLLAICSEFPAWRSEVKRDVFSATSDGWCVDDVKCKGEDTCALWSRSALSEGGFDEVAKKRGDDGTAGCD